MTAQLQPLTWAQQRLYNWIVGYVRKHGHSPTLRQMAEAMDLTSQLEDHLNAWTPKP